MRGDISYRYNNIIRYLFIYYFTLNKLECGDGVEADGRQNSAIMRRNPQNVQSPAIFLTTRRLLRGELIQVAGNFLLFRFAHIQVVARQRVYHYPVTS